MADRFDAGGRRRLPADAVDAARCRRGAGALPLDGQARVVGAYQWIERRSSRCSGAGWRPSRWPRRRLMFDIYSQQHAWHAELWAERLPVLDGLDPATLTVPPERRGGPPARSCRRRSTRPGHRAAVGRRAGRPPVARCCGSWGWPGWCCPAWSPGYGAPPPPGRRRWPTRRCDPIPTFSGARRDRGRGRRPKRWSRPWSPTPRHRRGDRPPASASEEVLAGTGPGLVPWPAAIRLRRRAAGGLVGDPVPLTAPVN